MATAGYSGTPLLKKLGVKEGMTALLIGVPAEVGDLAEFDRWRKVRRTAKPGAATGGSFDYIHLFTSKRAEYAAAIVTLKKALAPAGMIWASWPKKASGVACDMTDADIRALGLKAGLVDIKVCAIDETWSGLKFVIPLKDRKP